MSRFIPWKDIALYGGLALVSIIAAVWCVLTPQEWNIGKIVVVVTVPLAFTTVACIMILGRLFTRPTYVTSHGVAVWATKTGPQRSETETMFDHLIKVLPDFCEGWFDNVCDSKYAYSKLSTRAAMIMLAKRIKIEWRDKPLTVFSSYGWSVKDKAGLQQGKNVMVHWKGSIMDSALYHEMGHMVRQLVFKQPIDYKHEDKAWWSIVAVVKGQAKVD